MYKCKKIRKEKIISKKCNNKARMRDYLNNFSLYKKPRSFNAIASYAASIMDNIDKGSDVIKDDTHIH